MLQLLKALVAVLLLGVPLLVITALPRLFELATAASAAPAQTLENAAVPAFRAFGATPTSNRKFASLENPPPPTLAPPAVRPTPIAAPLPSPTGERIVIGNTAGRGAVLRSEPVTGKPVAALREQQVLDVVERRSITGSGEWVRVRTPEGTEGWVTGLVALVPTGNR